MGILPLYYYSSASHLTERFAQRLRDLDGRDILNLADSAVRHRAAPGPWVLLTPSYKAGNAAEATLPAGVRAFLQDPSPLLSTKGTPAR